MKIDILIRDKFADDPDASSYEVAKVILEQVDKQDLLELLVRRCAEIQTHIQDEQKQKHYAALLKPVAVSAPPAVVEHAIKIQTLPDWPVIRPETLERWADATHDDLAAHLVNINRVKAALRIEEFETRWLMKQLEGHKGRTVRQVLGGEMAALQ